MKKLILLISFGVFIFVLAENINVITMNKSFLGNITFAGSNGAWDWECVESYSQDPNFTIIDCDGGKQQCQMFKSTNTCNCIKESSDGICTHGDVRSDTVATPMNCGPCTGGGE